MYFPANDFFAMLRAPLIGDLEVALVEPRVLVQLDLLIPTLSSPSAAFLVLLAAAAGAGFVASGLGVNAQRQHPLGMVMFVLVVVIVVTVVLMFMHGVWAFLVRRDDGSRG